MNRAEIEKVLRAFGERCDDCQCVVVGGAAAILCGWLARITGDVDVIRSRPKLSALSREIQEAAEEFGLSESWINDGASAYRDVLPLDFEDRLVPLGRYGGLRIYAVSRKDFILLKLYSLRPEDLQDLREMNPSKEEIKYVHEQLDRISRFDKAKAHRIELYLKQGSR